MRLVKSFPLRVINAFQEEEISRLYGLVVVAVGGVGGKI